MDNIAITVGRFTATLTPPGAHPYSKRVAIVKFFDNKYAGEKSFGTLGQFVSSYYIDTFLAIPDGTPLSLHGGEPAWTVPGKDLTEFKRIIGGLAA